MADHTARRPAFPTLLRLTGMATVVLATIFSTVTSAPNPAHAGSGFDFSAVDTDGSGCVEGPEELQKFRLYVGQILARSLHLKPLETALRAGRITHSADVNGDGRICECDLLSILLTESTGPGMHRHAFRVYEDGSIFDDVDADNDGFLGDVTEQEALTQKLAQCVSDDKARTIVDGMAKLQEDDGKVARTEYLLFLKSPKSMASSAPQSLPAVPSPGAVVRGSKRLEDQLIDHPGQPEQPDLIAHLSQPDQPSPGAQPSSAVQPVADENEEWSLQSLREGLAPQGSALLGEPGVSEDHHPEEEEEEDEEEEEEEAEGELSEAQPARLLRPTAGLHPPHLPGLAEAQPVEPLEFDRLRPLNQPQNQLGQANAQPVQPLEFDQLRPLNQPQNQLGQANAQPVQPLEFDQLRQPFQPQNQPGQANAQPVEPLEFDQLRQPHQPQNQRGQANSQPLEFDQIRQPKQPGQPDQAHAEPVGFDQPSRLYQPEHPSHSDQLRVLKPDVSPLSSSSSSSSSSSASANNNKNDMESEERAVDMQPATQPDAQPLLQHNQPNLSLQLNQLNQPNHSDQPEEQQLGDSLEDAGVLEAAEPASADDAAEPDSPAGVSGGEAEAENLPAQAKAAASMAAAHPHAMA